jgi:DNA excision repair protein ERCC-2
VVKLPYTALRPGQELLIAAVEGIVSRGGVLLCAAPTGIGKTVAVLLPMLTAALCEGRQLVFVTPKVAQQAQVLAAVDACVGPGAGVTAVQIASRERFCPRDGQTCRPRWCRLRRDVAVGLRAGALAGLVAGRTSVSADALAQCALAADLCPFDVSVALGAGARVIVADFNHVFDPRAHIRRLFASLHAPESGDAGACSRRLLVVDEAHHLPERLAASLSPEVSRTALARGIRLARAISHPVFAAVADVLAEVDARASDALAERTAEGFAPPALVPLGALIQESLAGVIERVAAAYLDDVARRGEGMADSARSDDRDALAETLGALRALVAARDDASVSPVALVSEEALRAVCVDPGPQLRPRLRGFHATVCMSATLVPLELHAQRLGLLQRDVLRLELPSPFPRENRLVAVVPSLDTRLARRVEAAPHIASLIARTALAHPGSYLAFFPSYAFRDQVVAALPPHAKAALSCVSQVPGMPIEPLLRALARRGGRTVVVCGVYGGALAEGIDFAGELAIGVFAVGPGLPPVSPERELLRAHLAGATWAEDGAHAGALDAEHPGWDGTDGAGAPTWDDIGWDAGADDAGRVDVAGAGDGEGASERAVPGVSPERAGRGRAPRFVDLGFDQAYIAPGIARVVQACGRVIRGPHDRGVIVLIGRRFCEPAYRDKLPADWVRDWQVADDPVPAVRAFWARVAAAM